jgi:hypothetical protein
MPLDGRVGLLQQFCMDSHLFPFVCSWRWFGRARRETWWHAAPRTLRTAPPAALPSYCRRGAFRALLFTCGRLLSVAWRATARGRRQTAFSLSYYYIFPASLFPSYVWYVTLLRGTCFPRCRCWIPAAGCYGCCVLAFSIADRDAAGTCAAVLAATVLASCAARR